jgi:hypothetical protein
MLILSTKLPNHYGASVGWLVLAALVAVGALLLSAARLPIVRRVRAAEEEARASFPAVAVALRRIEEGQTTSEPRGYPLGTLFR